MPDNKTVVREFFASQDRLRGGPSPEICAEGYIAELASFPPMDREGHSAFAASFYEAFPDLEHKVVDVISEGDRVAATLAISGTNTGPFMGNAPTGKRVEFPAVIFATVASGQVVEMRGQFDQVGVMQQLQG